MNCEICYFHQLLHHIQDGQTPLYAASRTGQAAVVKLLLQYHTDINICKTVGKFTFCKSSIKNHDISILQYGCTPLMVASLNGHADVVQTLIEAKAQINTQEEVCCSYHQKTYCTIHHHTQCHCISYTR